MWADLLVVTRVNQQLLAGLREKRLCQVKLWFLLARLLCGAWQCRGVSQGCLREELHVRQEGLRSGEEHQGQAAELLCHWVGWQGMVCPSLCSVLPALAEFLGLLPLDVLSWLVCAPHSVLRFIGGLCLLGAGRTKAQLYSCCVPAFSPAHVSIKTSWR